MKTICILDLISILKRANFSQFCINKSLISKVIKLATFKRNSTKSFSLIKTLLKPSKHCNVCSFLFGNHIRAGQWVLSPHPHEWRFVCI